MMTSLRRSLGSKFCAGLFIVLIALPFTAPFRAWDTGTPFAKAPGDDVKAWDDLSDSGAIAASVICGAPVLAGDLHPVRAAASHAMRPPVLQLVLRL